MKEKKKQSKTIGSMTYPVLIESGTDEYQSKKNIQLEKIDAKGIFRRSRVLDQTKFDELFLKDKIDRNQYSAADMYLSLMQVSGCFLRSPSMSGGVKTGFRESANLMASRIMAISSARDSLRKQGEDCLIAVETCLALDKDVDMRLLKTGLDALARHFHIT
jgi:hypothetical protein